MSGYCISVGRARVKREAWLLRRCVDPCADPEGIFLYTWRLGSEDKQANLDYRSFYCTNTIVFLEYTVMTLIQAVDILHSTTV